MMEYVYTVYGITIASELEFPQLLTGSGAPDVWVRYGAVPEHLPSPVRTGVLFEVQQDSFLLRVEGIARYWMRAGRDVLVDVSPGALASQVSTFFLGSVLTAVLHQRGALVLHASGVVGSRGAALFAGHSGSGKSTLLAKLVNRGYEALGDDAVVVTRDATGQLLAHPGFPQIRLWADAVTRLGQSLEGLRRVFPGADKYALRPAGFRGCVPVPLAGLHVLGLCAGDDVRLEQVEGRERFSVVREYTKNVQILEGLQMQVPHFRLAAETACRVPIVRMLRPRGRDSLDELVRRVVSSLT